MKNNIYISIVGHSNTGKSSLVNFICNNYVTTESNKPQTTRVNLIHEVNYKENKFFLYDTPGISLKNTDLLSSAMKNSYIKTLEFTNFLIVMMDVNSKDFQYEQSIINLAKDHNIVIIIVVNKIDLLKDKNELIKIKNKIQTQFAHSIHLISVKTKEGITELLDMIKNSSINSNTNNASTEVSVAQMKLSIQEIIRGVINDKAHGEVPYDTAVYVEKCQISKALIKIEGIIAVEKLNQKKIIIGKNGLMIKEIGIKSRSWLEKIYNKKFYISLEVVVKKNWKNNYEFLKEIGYID
ncbi:MAG: GTPase Era [Gammaproteobacteria bacterium]|nr:GTPase Era [Gammaproteobacteria bacterium]|tara:strand:- start:3475 stop:4359 length:885 start_codon:yes stop_codon:yes gene_type:complete